MLNKDLIQVNIIPNSDNVIDDQRESGITHTPFQLEYVIYHAIQVGDEAAVQKAIENYLNNGLVIGRLSGDNMRQIKYWAVACVSVAIHYAILGGLDETDAFNLSDQYIRYIDTVKNMDLCISYLTKKAVELTMQVRESKEKNEYSPIICKCMHYIHIHLHERLMISQIANAIGVSRDYLSYLFKRETGLNIHAYIVHEKLEASKVMLIRGDSYDSISYQFAFCSETHYITCFKREYGITPRRYRLIHED